MGVSPWWAAGRWTGNICSSLCHPEGWDLGFWTVPVVIVTMTFSGHSFISFKVFLCIFLAVSLLHILWSLQMGRTAVCFYWVCPHELTDRDLKPGFRSSRCPKTFALRPSIGWACLPPGLENTKHSSCSMLSVHYKKLPDSSFWNQKWALLRCHKWKIPYLTSSDVWQSSAGTLKMLYKSPSGCDIWMNFILKSGSQLWYLNYKLQEDSMVLYDEPLRGLAYCWYLMLFIIEWVTQNKGPMVLHGRILTAPMSWV